MNTYLDPQQLARIQCRHNWNVAPYPWIHCRNLLTERGYRLLLESLPDISAFSPSFNQKRRHGQTSHDRYILKVSTGTGLDPHWTALLNELRGRPYRNVIQANAGTDCFHFRFQFHYTPGGCSVSPHCDTQDKIASHIFYFNTEDNWYPGWGGETWILNDGGRHNWDSAPGFGDFDDSQPIPPVGNHSLLFQRTANSWHGVKPLNCPPGTYRKVFVVSAIRKPERRSATC